MEISKNEHREKGNWTLGNMVFWEKDIGKNGNLKGLKFGRIEIWKNRY